MEPEDYNYLTFADAYASYSADEPSMYSRSEKSVSMYAKQYGKTALAESLYAEAKKKKEPQFKVGDTVVLKSGVAPQIVNKVMGDKIRCNYLTSRRETSFRSMSDFVHYSATSSTISAEAISKDNISVKTEKEEIMTTKLYKVFTNGVDGKERYGEWKANDGDKFILMMSDTGAYEAFAKSELKRVMDFTYDVMFHGTGRVYSYKGTEGEVAVGDILLDDGMAIVKVTAINTESETATKYFKGVKLNTTVLNATKS